MKISGFGLYPWHQAQLITPTCYHQLSLAIEKTPSPMIARGSGLSYGDSALSDTVLSSQYLNHFLAFDADKGILQCQSGVTLEQILQVILPHGWFLAVVPGTKKISLGGAIASDIHGKNHHCEGSFSQHVLKLKLLTASGEIIECGPQQNKEAFQASCGGMGLTGIILQATLQLKPVESAWLHQHTSTSSSLKQTLNQLKLCNDNYSVSWLDLTRLPKYKAIIMTANHGNSQQWQRHNNSRLTIPCYLPGFSLNHYFIKAFNNLYYRLNKNKQQHCVHYDKFFFALDGINQWNRCYGKAGLLQYQVVFPYTSAEEGITAIFNVLQQSKLTCNLAVLKNFGTANNNYLSFPEEGFTLAMDFKRSSETIKLFSQFDSIVLAHGGKLYLTKDATMPNTILAKSYPGLNQFIKVRNKLKANEKFHSLQSKRLGI